MYNKKILLSFILCAFILQGCNFPFNFWKKRTNVKSPNKIIINNDTPSESEEKKYLSKFTGEYVQKDSFDNTPFMAIIENSKASRPQYGLNSADIVYETLAEGGIPRFIALFQKNNCKKIGPIRSARKYFIDIANEYNLPFAHCGGSDEALNRISQNKEKSINEISNGGYFFRDKNRNPPHNLYTDSNKIRSFIKDKNYSSNYNANLKFQKKYWEDSSLSPANDILINLNQYYNTSYSFKDNKYIKSMDNVLSTDALTKETLYCNNIVIQLTDITLQEDGLHVDIRLKGEGNGYVVSNGKFKKVKWSKKTKNSPTTLLDEQGNLVPLSPGKTWWHIISTNSTIEIQ